MKKRILLFIVVAAAGVALWMWRTGQFSKPTNRILVSGNLELTLVDLSFKIAGRMTELTVREGDFVKMGQLIARLDPVQLQQQRARDQASVFNAQSNYDQLTTSIEFQKATIESDIASRRADVNQAQAHLDELLAGSRPEEIQQAEGAVTDARAQVDLARADWDRAQTLYKNEDISTSQYDQARTKFNSASAVLQQAQQKYALVKAGPRKEEIEGAAPRWRTLRPRFGPRKQIASNCSANSRSWWRAARRSTRPARRRASPKRSSVTPPFMRLSTALCW